MKLNKSFYVPFLLLICFVISGCGAVIKSEYNRYQHKENDLSNYSDPTHPNTQNKIITFGTNHIDEEQHINHSLHYSAALARQITSVPGVADSRVFITDKNAYVSVVFDATGRNYAISKDYVLQSNANNSAKAPNTITNNPFDQYTSINDSTQLTSAFKQTIADIIFANEKDIEEVHISGNKDFMFYMDEFAQVDWANEDLQTYMKQFNILVQHQFANGKIMPTSLKYYRNK